MGEHMAEHLAELRQHLGGEEGFKLVDSKVKAAMTRELNSGGGHAVRVAPPTKKRKGSAPEGDDMGEEGDMDAGAKKRRLGELDDVDDAPLDDGEANHEDVQLGGLLKQKVAKASAKSSGKSGKRNHAEIAAGSSSGTAVAG